VSVFFLRQDAVDPFPGLTSDDRVNIVDGRDASLLLLVSTSCYKLASSKGLSVRENAHLSQSESNLEVLKAAICNLIHTPCFGVLRGMKEVDLAILDTDFGEVFKA